jgi:membrane protein
MKRFGMSFANHGTNSVKRARHPSIWERGGLTWKQLSYRVWCKVYDGDILARAAALSYYFLLALFPLLLFMITMLGYFAEAGTELRNNLLAYLSRVMPRSASELIYSTVDEITRNRDSSKLSLGLLAALWVASSGMGAISETLNVAYGVKESRPWWRARLSAVILTIALTLMIITALALVLYGGEIGEGLATRLSLGGAFSSTWTILQWPIMLAFVLLAFALIYYFAPNVEDQKWYWITPGSLLGVAMWLSVSFAFRIYLRFFDTYSVAYGSLGAVIILMLWFYLSGLAILVGGELNAEIENAAAESGFPGAKRHGEKNPTRLEIKSLTPQSQVEKTPQAH